MANPKPTLLSQLHQLFGAESAARLLDGQLLDGFKTAHEQVAFAALVRRHGSMVLNVCRRVLHNDSDAEDAFQATFLVLARKAGGIGKRDALAAWLHKVAHRVALRAKTERTLRQEREQQATARLGEDPLATITGRELLTALDEELQKLPERLRAPLIVCYLEEQTQEKAARLLSLSVRTLKRRLQQGREALRRRLERRGLAMPSVFLTAATFQGGTKTALSGVLVAGTVKAALNVATGQGVAGIVSVETAKLVAGTLHAMALSKVKTAAAVVIALTLLGAGLGVAGYRTIALNVEAQATPSSSKQSPPAPTKLQQTKPDDPETIVFGGQVLDAQKKPVAGAHVSIWGTSRDGHFNLPADWVDKKALAEGQTDRQGNFRLLVPRKPLANYAKLYVVAGKIENGLVLENILLEASGAAKTSGTVPNSETVLRLPAEKIIRGRAVDLQGQPIEGVKVQVASLGLGKSRALGSVTFSWSLRETFPLWPSEAVTDKDGRFIVHGLSPSLWATLEINDDRFTRQSFDIGEGSPDEVFDVNLALAPAKILEGTVTAADTGKPLPNVRLQLFVDGQRVMFGETDDKGRYRLKLPASGKELTVTAEQMDGPYPPFSKSIEWPSASIRQQLNIAVPRGVLLRGKVTEVGNGQPVSGAVVHDYGHRWIRSVTTGPDGIFQISVPPGKGHLLIKHKDNDFIAMQITEGEIAGGEPAGWRVYPDAVISYDAKTGPEAQAVEATLRRGTTLKGRVLTPDGKPVAEGILVCWSQVSRRAPGWFGDSIGFRDGRFELRGCDPAESYTVYFLDGVNKLGATVQLSAKDAGENPVTVRLEPCGSAVGRFVNKKGEPIVKSQVLPYFVLQMQDKKVLAVETFIQNVDRLNYPNFSVTDEQGGCTFPVLIPGATYRITGYEEESVRDFTVRAGETLQLGDIVLGSE
jgi:RNA polymerase sigma factor (sigma-70 family)